MPNKNTPKRTARKQQPAKLSTPANAARVFSLLQHGDTHGIVFDAYTEFVNGVGLDVTSREFFNVAFQRAARAVEAAPRRAPRDARRGYTALAEFITRTQAGESLASIAQERQA